MNWLAWRATHLRLGIAHRYQPNSPGVRKPAAQHPEAELWFGAHPRSGLLQTPHGKPRSKRWP